ncbi:MAG: hypothetical protein H6582_05615 [Crocinitomicaceae bacterium]|nr:hypothetical protein [Crocinitomicaceae bacterium]
MTDEIDIDETEKYETLLQEYLDLPEFQFIGHEDKTNLYVVLKELFAEKKDIDIESLIFETGNLPDPKSIRNKNNWYKYFLHVIDEKDISYSDFSDLLNKGTKIKTPIRKLIKEGKKGRLISISGEFIPETLTESKALFTIYLTILRDNKEYYNELAEVRKRLISIIRSAANETENLRILIDLTVQIGKNLHDIEVSLSLLHSLSENIRSISNNSEVLGLLVSSSKLLRNKCLLNHADNFMYVFWTYRMVNGIIDNVHKIDRLSDEEKDENDNFIRTYIENDNLTKFVEYCIIRSGYNSLFTLTTWGENLYGNYSTIAEMLASDNSSKGKEAKAFLNEMSFYNYSNDESIPFNFNHLYMSSWDDVKIDPESKNIKSVILKCIDLEIKSILITGMNFQSHPWGFKPVIQKDENMFRVGETIKNPLEKFVQNLANASHEVLQKRLNKPLELKFDDNKLGFKIIDPNDSAVIVESVSTLPN